MEAAYINDTSRQANSLDDDAIKVYRQKNSLKIDYL
jgi:hypothetical protein